MGRIDLRLIILAGFLLTAYSLWQMTGFSPLMGTQLVLVSGIIQGFGLGFLFVPLTTVAFATLAPQLRTEGAAIFSLMRNVGSSVGISIIQAMLTENTQILHASLANHVTAYNRLAHPPFLTHGLDIATKAGLAALNVEVTNQAAMIAYIDDYKLMMIIAIAAIPLILILRKAGRPSVETAAHAID
jgi:DHA2 family multidrug resistance protein